MLHALAEVPGDDLAHLIAVGFEREAVACVSIGTATWTWVVMGRLLDVGDAEEAEVVAAVHRLPNTVGNLPATRIEQ
jgi:hypothetical protein